MNKAKHGDMVSVHYIAKVSDDIIFDSNKTKPLELTIGKHQVIPAFEDALIGMIKGESKNIQVLSNEAFGPYLKELVSTVEKSKIPNNLDLKIGKQLQILQPDGSSILVTVTAIDDETATFDANHPLAGKDIMFLIKLLEII